MHLAAYYIYDNKYGIKNQTINLGGKYFYTLCEVKNRKIKITRTLNKKYIPHFYDSTEKLTQVSAVVGRNGAGKTTLLKSLIFQLNDYNNKNYFLYENGDKIILLNSDNTTLSKDDYFEIDENIELEKKEVRANVIYYSPHLDFKGKLGKIDISVDSFMYDDLEEIESINYFDLPPNPIKQHEVNNFRRQMELYSSTEISEKLYANFNLPKPERVKISFVKIDKIFNNNDFWKGDISFNNTPNQFRFLFKEIVRKVRIEKDVRPNRHGVLAQKKLLKEYILLGFISTIIRVMEKQNTFLEEGRVEQGYEDKIKNFEAIELLYYFLDTHYYVLPEPSKSIKIPKSNSPIPSEIIKRLLTKLFSTIDKLTAKNDFDTRYFDWDNKCIYPLKEDFIEIHTLVILFIDRMGNYYQSAYASKENLVEVISFINFEWYDRNPSSGEQSVFNLFSRLLAIKKEIEKAQENYYFLLIDEGDAGFHPEWKKKYVDIITEVTPLLFDKPDVSFQIIFTTHDPFSLSDVLNYNIVYLDKKDGDSHKIMSTTDDDRPQKSFGANITDLLSDSFFIGDGLIGDFSKRKIRETINWLNNKDEKTDTNSYYEKLIRNIDEPIVQRKLSEMYDEKMHTKTQLTLIDEQIANLQKQKSKIK